MPSPYCPFCDPKVIEKNQFYETPGFRCFYNHKPVLPGHSMILPKRHVESLVDLYDSELNELGGLVKDVATLLMRAYGCTGFDSSLQNGSVAGASVAHVHFHIVPRKEGDIEGDPSSWMAEVIKAENRKTPISDTEIRKNVEKIRNVLSVC